MSKKEFDEYRATAVCTMQGVQKIRGFEFLPIEREDDDTEVEWSRLFMGDSWFGLVKTVANLGKMNQHAIMQVKTAHTRTRKLFIENTMNEFPGGTWIVLRRLAEKEGIELGCIGYKYNKSKTLTFVFTIGSGITTKEDPY